eukprot:g42106.t1
MWEIADRVASCSDHICSKCWLLEELWLRFDELESELWTLQHILEGESYLDALFQEVVTPARLSTSNLVRGQGQPGVSTRGTGRWILYSGTEEPQPLNVSNRVRDIFDRLKRILEQEEKDPVVVVHIWTNNIDKMRKQDLLKDYQELGTKSSRVVITTQSMFKLAYGSEDKRNKHVAERVVRERRVPFHEVLALVLEQERFVPLGQSPPELSRDQHPSKK